MLTKTFEIIDKAWSRPVIATKITPWCAADTRLLAQAGIGFNIEGRSNIILVTVILDGEGCSRIDAQGWPYSPRGLRIAHHYFDFHFDILESGELIDIEYLVGETKTKRIDDTIDPSIFDPISYWQMIASRLATKLNG